MQRIVQSVEKVNNDSLKNLLFMRMIDSMKNEERLELVERFARNLASGEVR